MPNQNKTEIICVLDRSGSMHSIAKDMIGGFQSFIDEQSKLPGTCLVTLYQFDDQFEVVYEGRNIGGVSKLVLVPRGQTALFDAIGMSIAKTIERHDALPEAQQPGAVIFLIITDGAENASREYREVERVQAAIKEAEEERKWQVVFLAADLAAFQASGSMGVNVTRAANVDKTSRGINQMYKASSRAVEGYRISASEGDLSRGIDINEAIKQLEEEDKD